MIELTKVKTDSAMRLIRTLRRMDLALSPVGKYNDPQKIFNIWNFAKKYGTAESDSKQK